ncbi:ubiquinone biosynthesis O-methyltransferase, mitochondrial isoform X1 [Pseudoliparis swirei]|uniref:ubiquinone biosynthesis O-methyltransferase, mitochondrial isoform X1 n=1 Tax=Pseudoliparis swirei TaxID=2059687 RepID=UPI0024BF1056|nr:ubiquinone biosynthesis O-methyltransferase, mitochondrial isoform X1 [Pseudoliparis swirei]
MFGNKSSRLVSGLLSLKTTAAARSAFSRTAGGEQRALWLQERGCPDTRRHVVTCHSRARSASQPTVDPDELRRFQSLAGKWWDEGGEFAALHAMNDLRVPFIRDNLLNVHGPRRPGKPLGGLRVLDVGCGGGLLTEPLGRLGADVLGIDPVGDSIGTARLHSARDPDLRDRVCYRACTLEELSAEREGGEEEEEEEEEEGVGQYDAIVASEVVEHLADLETFASCCNHVLKQPVVRSGYCCRRAAAAHRSQRDARLGEVHQSCGTGAPPGVQRFLGAVGPRDALQPGIGSLELDSQHRHQLRRPRRQSERRRGERRRPRRPSQEIEGGGGEEGNVDSGAMRRNEAVGLEGEGAM